MPVDPRMITLAREARGWNQSDFAERLGLTQGYVSKLESGYGEIDDSMVNRIADELDCPVALLTYSAPSVGIEVTCLHHRRRASTMSAGTKKRIDALAKLTRISVEGLMTGVEMVRRNHIDRAHADETVDPADSAAQTRMAIGIADGPIENVVRAVESAGVIIVHRALGTTAQDAVSTWPQEDNATPMMLVNTGLAPDRLRFTVAHELGHLVMHAVPGEDQEIEADRFASAFLAPADQVRPDLEGLGGRDMGRLIKAKTKWGMSIAALIRRAHDLNIIDDKMYRDYQIQISRLGWRNSEPGQVPTETPALLAKLIQMRQEQQHLDTGAIARLAFMNEPAFRHHYMPDDNPKVTMKLVVGND